MIRREFITLLQHRRQAQHRDKADGCGLFWQVSGELGLALIGADSEVLSQSPEQIAEVSAEPPEYLLLRSPDLGPRSSAAANS